jgi:hypothetical protein
VLNTRQWPFVAVLLAFVLGAVGLSACGGGGGGGDADKVLKETFGGNKKVRSGKLEIKLGLDPEGGTLGGPVSLVLAGPFESQGPKQLPKFDFDLALSLGAGKTITAGAVSTGDSGFLKFEKEDYEVPADVFKQFKDGYEKSQAKTADQKGNTSFASLGVDPRKWLKDAKTEDDTDIAGTATKHVSAKVDVPKLLDDVNRILSRAGDLGVSQSQQIPNQLSDKQRKAVEDAVEDATFDVYSGKDDKTLRRLTINIKFKVPEDKRASAQGLTGGTITFDLTIADLNQAQSIEAPSNPKPFEDLSKALKDTLGGLLGGAAGGTGGTGGTSGGTDTTGGSGSSGDSGQDYAKCIADAGGDIAKAQKCQSILTGG